jgi:hypothetical protein
LSVTTLSFRAFSANHSFCAFRYSASVNRRGAAGAVFSAFGAEVEFVVAAGFADCRVHELHTVHPIAMKAKIIYFFIVLFFIVGSFRHVPRAGFLFKSIAKLAKKPTKSPSNDEKLCESPQLHLFCTQ